MGQPPPEGHHPRRLDHLRDGHRNCCPFHGHSREGEQLWRYYPQLLAATSDDIAAPWALDLWRRLPVPHWKLPAASGGATSARLADSLPAFVGPLRRKALILSPQVAKHETLQSRWLVCRRNLTPFPIRL